MTGLITLLGWAGHEAGWRFGLASVDTICSDIQMMYENPGFTLHLMEKYGVTYLFVGEVEQEKYRVSLPPSRIRTGLCRRRVCSL